MLTPVPTLNFSLFYGDSKQMSGYQEEGFLFPIVSNKAKTRNVNKREETGWLILLTHCHSLIPFMKTTNNPLR